MLEKESFSGSKSSTIREQIMLEAEENGWLVLYDDLDLVIERSKHGEFANNEEYQAAIDAVILNFAATLQGEETEDQKTEDV